MQNQLSNLTKSDWVTKAQKSDAEYVKCFVPVIALNYMHHVHPVDRDLHYPFKTYINEGGASKLKDQLIQTGLKVLHLSDNIIDTIHAVQNGTPSMEDQFLNKERNIFIIELSDTLYTYKNIVIVCEYDDIADPLAKHTVDYDAVKQQEKSKQLASNFIKSMREASKNSPWD